MYSPLYLFDGHELCRAINGSIKLTWKLAKIRNKNACGTSRELLDSHLWQFMWRRWLKNKNLFVTMINVLIIIIFV